MQSSEILQLLSVAENLKNNTRHSDTSTGRRESVAEHSWRLCFFAMLVAEDFPEADIDRVIAMCVVHDLGEAFTGDIPTFEKTAEDQKKEAGAFEAWLASLPQDLQSRLRSLVDEMAARETVEAKIYKSLDKLEAIIQHNEADISSWLPLEYELQLTYAMEECAWSPVFARLREDIRQVSAQKIANEAKRRGMTFDELCSKMHAEAEKMSRPKESTEGEL